jgi:hypothetical protein
MTRPLLFLHISCLCLAADPNSIQRSKAAWDILVSHWLEVKSTDVKEFDPNVPSKHIFTIWPCNNNRDSYLIVRCKDPNDSLQVTSFHKNRLDYSDFNMFARGYPGDPNFIPPVEPNLLSDPCNIDPNLLDILAGVTDTNLLLLFNSLLKEQP